jgi:pyruvate/2-oxoglutarate dehydrogenase complex dihydrolipoamide dehydrogenase (E3) component
MHGYELHLYKFGLHSDRNSAGDVLKATGSEPTVPEPYGAYTQVFLKIDSESMPSHVPQDLAIKLLNSKQLP